MLKPSVPAWFEIPATDLDRAARFYETLTGAKLRRETMGPVQMAVFPNEKPHPTGALVRMDGYAPSSAGSVVYLNLDDITPALARAARAGGEVLVPRTALPDEIGYYALIRDSEGNRVGVYSQV
jgi:hypothetical protein